MLINPPAATPPPPVQSPTADLHPLRDCSPCDGSGVMTARPASDLHGSASTVACPVCEGRGAFVVVRDLQARP